MPGDYLSEVLADDQKLLMSGSYIEVKPQPFIYVLRLAKSAES